MIHLSSLITKIIPLKLLAAPTGISGQQSGILAEIRVVIAADIF